ncbi:histidinol dehydrogenase [Solirubrobacter phytolaccae]|uniref:Histidinol dehydrogenase n=1 Tax=Solirubrobacter phytolaccae TaxID=1404360 RepID=A0A9X3NFJ6_9ACTN|nr:histidinol dehydrogenase [Solirubrobacter phytolaccae]MDA0184344.1 histidinol dehydrogenase [Solirubrobacter phytolaccae]
MFLKDAPWHAPAIAAEVRARVSELLLAIERGGEREVRRLSQVLDGWSPPSFVLDAEEIRAATDAVDPGLAEHIAFAQAQVRGFARAQRETLRDLEVEPLPGVTLGHRHLPVRAVGAYIPGGRYPMLASAFMSVAVAKEAGVRDVTACAPPRARQGLDPAMIHAIATSGADRILCLGGVQALAAMAFGLCGAEPADMLVGPGNAYVAEAKRQLFGTVGIDLLAGPTEIAVIADTTADPFRVAADLLGQAEHGPTSPALLITTSEDLGHAVLAAVDELLPTWPTREVAGEAWRRHGSVAVVPDDAAAMALSDAHAPEHLEVHVAESKLGAYHAGLRCYGALFLGAEATVAYGDKAIGTNHVLPTMGAGRFTGGLWVGSFLRTCTYQRLTAAGTREVAPAVAAISHAEGFAGHARTAGLRLAAAEAGA